MCRPRHGKQESRRGQEKAQVSVIRRWAWSGAHSTMGSKEVGSCEEKEKLSGVRK